MARNSLYISEDQLPNVQYGGQVYKKFARRYPHLKDDLYCEMTHAVLLANRRLEQRTTEGVIHDNPSAYVRMCVKGYLQTLVVKSHVMGVGFKTFLKKGGEVKKQEHVNLNHRPGHCSDPAMLLELTEIISQCVNDEREHYIFYAEVSGESHIAMAEKLQISAQRVGQILHALRERIQWTLQNGGKCLIRSADQCPRREMSCGPRATQKSN